MTEKAKDFPFREMEILNEWAISKIRERGNPPWVWYRLWQLRDAIDGCKRSFEITSQAEADLLGSELREDASPPPQGQVVQIGKPRRRRDIPPVDLPM